MQQQELTTASANQSAPTDNSTPDRRNPPNSSGIPRPTGTLRSTNMESGPSRVVQQQQQQQPLGPIVGYAPPEPLLEIWTGSIIGDDRQERNPDRNNNIRNANIQAAIGETLQIVAETGGQPWSSIPIGLVPNESFWMGKPQQDSFTMSQQFPT